MHLIDANQKLYVCPGETEPISHAVHLGRLARFYPACRACPLNCESGETGLQLTDRLQERLERDNQELQRPFGQIRGVYLNRITRRIAGEIVGHFAEGLWSEINRAVRTHRREKIVQWAMPRVVIGYDQRSSSPDIVTGVQDRLRLMGCNVVDLGLTTGPALQFAVRLHHARSGVFVSGCGAPPAWTGLDFFSTDGLPCDVSHLSVSKPADPPQPMVRPLRSSGDHTFRPVNSIYTTRLQAFVRPTRSLRVCVGVEDRVAREHVQNVLAPMGPQNMTVVPLPKRVRDLSDSEDIDVRRVGVAVIEAGADLGFVIDEDMRRCGLLDDLGELATARQLVSLLEPDSTTPMTGLESLRNRPQGTERCIAFGDNTIAFPNQSIRCDAAMTLGQLVTRLSRTRRPVSALIDDLARRLC